MAEYDEQMQLDEEQPDEQQLGQQQLGQQQQVASGAAQSSNAQPVQHPHVHLFPQPAPGVQLAPDQQAAAAAAAPAASAATGATNPPLPSGTPRASAPGGIVNPLAAHADTTQRIPAGGYNPFVHKSANNQGQAAGHDPAAAAAANAHRCTCSTHWSRQSWATAQKCGPLHCFIAAEVGRRALPRRLAMTCKWCSSRFCVCWLGVFASLLAGSCYCVNLAADP
ncbi:hypothetical protein COO60DRAFT_906321 [Scenedesmus sp. NREL 46B-D3]|nr:hypothetical protein COO60DRAFT_906321 [Scenedesmus sp. NREL 46B-D3]